MSSLQFLAFVFIALIPWWGRALRRRGSYPAMRWGERLLAAGLLLAYLGDLGFKIADGQFTPAHALPMQLCDWALVAIVLALWRRWPAAFDLAYFWGLAGTFQALFTPAIAADLFWVRRAGFFFMHAGIVAGVLHLVLNADFRPKWPRSILRIVVASEIYLLTALTVNTLTGGNYGFLSRRPENRSLLDLFPDSPVLYPLALNLVGFLFFTLLYLPWPLLERRRQKTQAA